MQFSYGDPEIRSELHRKKFDRYASRDDVLVIDELGLAHAKSRIDIAVINGCIHGYEIKSEKDSLFRFPTQLETYRKTLSRLTVVCASKHTSAITQELPEWCGLIEIGIGARGGVHFHTLRKAKQNPEIDSSMMAQLLWHNEAADLLSNIGVSNKELRQPRLVLYKMIAEAFSEKQLTKAIREKMHERKTWRVPPIQPSYGG